MVKIHRHKGRYRSKTPRGYIVYKKRPLHKLSKEKRGLFTYLDKKPYETGGYMDFNKEGLEQVKLYYGRPGSVDIPVDYDYEIDFHSHPKALNVKDNRRWTFPSKWDVKSFKEYPSQSMIIFHNNKATITTKTSKFRVNNKKLNRLYKELNKDAEHMDVDKLYRKYRPQYRRLGLDLKYIKHNKAFRIPINIVEPKWGW